jgi:hypothetical protein
MGQKPVKFAPIIIECAAIASIPVTDKKMGISAGVQYLLTNLLSIEAQVTRK